MATSSIVVPNNQIRGAYPQGIADDLNAVAASAVADLGKVAFDVKAAIGFATANAAVLYTVPALAAGQRLRVNRVWWEITTPFTGGAASAIGVSTTDALYNTKGDLLGGATGDVAATLVTGFQGGTLGAKFGANGIVVLVPGDVVRFDQITSAFTAGAGFVHISFEVV